MVMINSINIKKFVAVTAIAFFLWGCSEERHNPVTDDDYIPPPVSNVEVENLPGGAAISYNLATGAKTLYVEAEWELADGRTMKAQSSRYNNFLEIEGLGDTSVYELELYAVGRNLKRSEPVPVQIQPLTPPIVSVLNSIVMERDFGGFRMDFINENEAEVSIEVFTPDSLGEWKSVDIFYTALESGRLFVRGFEPEERAFGVVVKDRWGNKTSMHTQSIVPLYEQKLDQSKFAEYPLPGDAEVYEGSAISNIWSGNYMGDNNINSNSFFRSANGVGVPHHITFDLGVTAKLGRYVLWQRGTYISPYTFVYAGGGIRRWEIWGSTNPNALGSWDGWTKLLDCEIEKPSGLPAGQTTNDDITAAQAGHQFTFSSDSPPVRYIRIRITNTWGGTGYSWFGQVSFFGDPLN